MSHNSIKRLDIKKTILFICDVQEGFKSRLPPQVAINFCQRCHLLNETAKILKIPRIITEQYPQGLGSTVSDIILEVKQTPLAPYHIFSKTKFSMLIDDIKKLLEQYKSEGRTQVILFGMETHACIMQTTLDLLVEGMEVHIAVDACMSLRSYDRDIGLDRLKSEGAVVHTAEGIVFDLIRDSKHEKFRELATLIKDIKLNPWENY